MVAGARLLNVKVRSLTALFALLLAAGCARISAQLSPEFAAHKLACIAIPTPRSAVGEGGGADELAEYSAIELEAAGYEVIRPLEVAEALGEEASRLEASQVAKRLGADAVLDIRVLRWDYRARVYSSDYTVAASFRLIGSDGTELWRVDEHFESASREYTEHFPTDRLRADVDDERPRLAARLAARVLETLPERGQAPASN